MKKILLLISVFLISGCCDTLDSGHFEYKLKNDPTLDEDAYIVLFVKYELPEHRNKDFLGTILLMMTKPELNHDLTIFIEYREDNGTSFLSDFGGLINDEIIEVTVDNNSSYHSSVKDPKDVNYYTKIVTYEQSRLGEEAITVQMYLRQDLEPTTAISYMIMTKPLNGKDYEYVLNTFLNQMSITSTHVDSKPSPLPDILR